MAIDHRSIKASARASTCIPGHALMQKPRHPLEVAADSHRGREHRLRQETGGTERA